MINFILNAWKVIECMIRVWDYAKFKKSLQFAYKIMRNNAAELHIKLKGTDSPLIFQLQITGDIMVYIPKESDFAKSKDSNKKLPGNVRRQLDALMYAPTILVAFISEVTAAGVVLWQFKTEMAGLISQLIK